MPNFYRLHFTTNFAKSKPNLFSSRKMGAIHKNPTPKKWGLGILKKRICRQDLSPSPELSLVFSRMAAEIRVFTKSASSVVFMPLYSS